MGMGMGIEGGGGRTGMTSRPMPSPGMSAMWRALLDAIVGGRWVGFSCVCWGWVQWREKPVGKKDCRCRELG